MTIRNTVDLVAEIQVPPRITEGKLQDIVESSLNRLDDTIDTLVPDQTTAAGQVLTSDGANVSWQDAAGGMNIGDPATGGTANAVVYIDGSGNVANSANLTFDGTYFYAHGLRIAGSDNANTIYQPTAALTISTAGGDIKLNAGTNYSVIVNAGSATDEALIVKGAASQSANLQEWQDSGGVVLTAIGNNGVWIPASMANAAAANSTVFYSTDNSDVVFKDSSGTVRSLSNSSSFVTLTGVQTLTNKTLTTPTIGSFTNATHNHQNAAGGGTLAEAALVLTNVTTNDATSSKHGFCPKLSGSTGNFLRGDGTFATVPTSITLNSTTVSGATATQVFYTGGGGVITSNSGLTFNGTTGTLTTTKIVTGGGTISLFSSSGVNPTITSTADLTIQSVDEVNLTTGIGLNITGTTYIFPSANTDVVLTVVGAASQSGDLQQWQNNGGTAIAKITAGGDGWFQNVFTTNSITSLSGVVAAPYFTDVDNTIAYIQTNTDSTHAWTLHNRTASKTAFSIQGASSQSAHLQEWQDSTGTPLAYVTAAGGFTCGDLVTSDEVIFGDSSTYHWTVDGVDLGIKNGASWVGRIRIGDSGGGLYLIGSVTDVGGGLRVSGDFTGIYDDTSDLGSDSIRFKNLYTSRTVHSKAFVSDWVTVTYASTTTFDASTGSRFSVTLTGSPTFAFSNFVEGVSYELEVIQDSGGSHTITFPGSVVWMTGATGAVQPATPAAAVTIYSVQKRGSSFYIFLAGKSA